jgi:hypothetical protein
VFSTFGDTANYALVPGGNFEGSTAGWSLNGASVAQGNEPWQVGGASDSQSLNIPAGGSATSPVVCISSLFPKWRFFANAPQGGTLHIYAQYTTSWGLSGQVWVANLYGSNYSSWQPTNALPLGSVLPAGTTANVRFVFTTDSWGGSAWNIDDVYVDPYAI